jgi:hypothetical protein
MTHSDLFSLAYAKIRVGRAGDVMNPDDAELIRQIYNQILDAWNADGRAAYAVTYTDYTLTPSLSPHTIGPGGTFVVTVRPEALVDAAINLGGSPAAFVPIHVRDQHWYARQPVPAQTTTYPTDVYYEANWPLGKLYFWGIPTTAYGVRLWTRVLLSAITDPTTDFSLPPGYQDALVKTLTEEIAEAFGQPRPDPAIASLARDRIFGNNDPDPTIATADAGLRGQGGGTGFNWLTRQSS